MENLEIIPVSFFLGIAAKGFTLGFVVGLLQYAFKVSRRALLGICGQAS